MDVRSTLSAIPKTEISIAGGGPAGLAAALAALGEGRAAHVFEQSHIPRHKVCGEFLSSEVAPVLDALGVYSRFMDARPARLTGMKLHFGKREKRCFFPEPALSLSRYALDELLWREAEAGGAVMHRERIGAASVIAYGRKGIASGGDRWFGFKAHFEGPTDDAVELFFSAGGYVGVSAVEGGRTNVCGIAPESALRRIGFHIDDIVAGIDGLAGCLRPLSRCMA